MFSAGTLGLGLRSMGIRYALAALVAYGAFLLAIRIWIAVRRNTADLDLDISWIDPGLEGPAGNGHTTLFNDGQSGGAGGGASWGSADAASGGDSSSAVDLPFDLDEGLPIVIVIAIAAGAVLAAGYVVYTAPALLAEVIIDAALASSAYRRLRPRPGRNWAQGLVRRTWVPALLLAVSVGAAGLALDYLAPGADSIGGVVRPWRAD
jgi:hypothetical protein